jgi:hypothetical protein
VADDPSERLGEGAIDELRERLLRWYADNGRDLPWRRTHDPYAILVSEVMLQQTQVSRVLPKYTAFLERFPDLGALAEAPLTDVLALWSGLGYNNRAVRLKRAASAARRHSPAPSRDSRACPASVRTPRAPSSSSPTTSTSPQSTPISGACFCTSWACLATCRLPSCSASPRSFYPAAARATGTTRSWTTAPSC